ncbi:MAG: acyltransferase family protein [Clostridium sp.]|nr:acyltransferase family protein [Clostridium sp.]
MDKIDENMSQRITIVKFIFMIMVVFIHSDATPELPYKLYIPSYVSNIKSFITDGICSMAVPGFFLISGMLLGSKEFTWAENMKKKVRSILVPYIIINTFWILFFKVMQAFPQTAGYFSGEAYQINGIKEVISAFINPMPLYYPFWFLRDLFIVNIFAKIINIIIDKYLILSIYLIAFLYLGEISIPLLVSKESLCMFAIGCCLAKCKLEMKKIDEINGFYILCVYIGSIFFRKASGGGTARLLNSSASLLFCFWLAGKIINSKWKSKILWCAQFTFFIYAFHEFYEAMIKKIIMIIIPQNGVVQLLEFLCLPIVITIVLIIIGSFLKKHMQRIYKIICGNR